MPGKVFDLFLENNLGGGLMGNLWGSLDGVKDRRDIDKTFGSACNKWLEKLEGKKVGEAHVHC